ncbi:hypothetical protein G7Y89_g7323 [Cudoniella acicularis]|uniref:Uncharacterized protein n=1 Tax=Cudoniella acicularis TaxID=354080 RepID=A0A8H4RIS2_9HELO|nr:hypothetical protein G7Y89_g7323 [Cudoniella acicularis]
MEMAKEPIQDQRWRRWFGLGIAALARDILGNRVPILALQKGCRQQFFRFTLDCYRIERVKFLNHWPTRNGHRLGASWYIVEKSSRLRDFNLQSLDTLNPPAWDSCYYFGEEIEGLQRMRSISLDQNITGMTVFCTRGRIYGIHTYHGRSLAVDTYSRLTKRLQDQVVWLYFLLGPREIVDNIFVRFRYQSPTIKSSNPIIIIHTSHGRLYTCGQYVEPSDSRYRYHRLYSRPVSQLLYRDPDPGQPILYFGVDSYLAAGAEPALENLDSVDCPIYRLSIYYSYASLENVDSVRWFYDLGTEEQPAQ